MENPRDKILIVDMESYFSESFNVDFETYPKFIEDELKNLITTEISPEKYSDILVVGRKGINLFQPYIKQVKIRNDLQGVYFIQLFTHTYHPTIKSLYPIKISKTKFFWFLTGIKKKLFGDMILLTDAIKRGNEISTILEGLDITKISKICGYLANKQGLENLQLRYPDIQFSFKKIIEDSEYDKEQDKLQYIYQSRLIPIDGDHPYRIYFIDPSIKIEELLGHIEAAIKTFLPEDFEIKKDYLIVPYISSYTINLDYNAILREYPDIKQELFEIERVQIRIKFDPNLSHLRIMALALDQTNSDDVTQIGVVRYQDCGLDFSNRLCSRTVIPPLPQDNPSEKVCPFCIDMNISNIILSCFERNLSDLLKSRGIQISRLDI